MKAIYLFNENFFLLLNELVIIHNAMRIIVTSPKITKGIIRGCTYKVISPVTISFK